MILSLQLSDADTKLIEKCAAKNNVSVADFALKTIFDVIGSDALKARKRKVLEFDSYRSRGRRMMTKDAQEYVNELRKNDRL